MRRWAVFWGGCLAWAFTRIQKGEPVMTQVAPWAWMFIGTVSTLGGVGGIGQSLAQKNPVWLLMLIPFAFLALFIAPYKTWKREYEKVIGYETVNLDIFYDDENDACKRDLLDDDGEFLQRLWRVGVKGTRGKPSKGVVVRLETTEPFVTDLPAALHPFGGEGMGEPHWRGDGSFDIRPGDTEYVEVIRYQPTKNGEDRLWITFQLGYPIIGRPVTFRSYTLQLTARGNDGPGTFARFRLEVGDGIPQFYQLANGVSAP